MPLLAFGGVVLAQESVPLDIYTKDSTVRRQPAATVFPKYPEDARLFRLEGETTVCFRINAQGEIVRPKVASSTDRIFERPALRAIRASSFTPLEVGQADSVADDVCRVFRFRLTPLAAPDATSR
jgi:TonB family protein